MKDALDAFLELSQTDAEANDAAPFAGLHLDSDLEASFYAPFQPSPMSMIDESLAFAVSHGRPRNPVAGWTMVDLGSGDGRWCIVGAQKHRFSEALGIDIDEDLVVKAQQTARECGVGDRARFVAADFGTIADPLLEACDVVVCYLLPDSVVLPAVSRILLSAYDRGAVVVAPHFDLSQLGAGFRLWHATASGAFLYRKPEDDGEGNG
ncbi:hypothetical protein DFJ74DRAFT_653509 [Hyaloraphidium curvatum]|nr:hypothetical protein DFJ74DRAFT_653509 [Hyaloraphidium curvatum]